MSSPPGPIVFSNAVVENQTFLLFDRYNETFPILLSQVDYYRKYGIVSGVIYASQIGATIAVFVILLMLTRAEKRKSPVFILNSAALFFNFIGAILQCLYYTGPWFSPYVYLSGDYFAVPESAKRVSIAPGPFICLVLLAILTSLVLQLRVVCVTLNPLQRLLISMISLFVALVAFGFRIAQVTINNECNINEARWCSQYLWVYKAEAITTTIAICFFSVAFCAKLGWSLHQRRRMGLTQFGPMQIIFIGGFQTLIIPAIFTILQFASDIPEISSNILTVTAISLPLSSLWASASTNKPSAGARGPDAHRKFIVDTTTANSTRNMSIGKAYGASPSSKPTNEKQRLGVLSSVDSESIDTPRMQRWPLDEQVEKDMEMQDLQGKH